VSKGHKTESFSPTDFRPPEASTSRKLPVKLLAIGIPLTTLAVFLLYFVTSASSLQVRVSPEAQISTSFS